VVSGEGVHGLLPEGLGRETKESKPTAAPGGKYWGFAELERLKTTP